jgi:hypothetical protein
MTTPASLSDYEAAIASLYNSGGAVAPPPVVVPPPVGGPLPAAIMPAIPTPSPVPTKVVDPVFPGGGPANYVLTNSAKYMNIFPVGASIVLTLTTNATSWTCRDIYGNTSTGTLAGGTTTLTPTPPAGGSTWPCGWYRMAFFQAGANVAGGWGTQCGDGTFLVMNDGVTGLPGPTQFPNGVAYSNAAYGTWVPPLTTACGTIPARWSIQNAGSPSTGVTDSDPYDGGTTTAMTEILAYDATWFLAYSTTARPHVDFISWPNGTVDVVNALTGAVLGLGAGAALTVLTKTATAVWVRSTAAGTVIVSTSSGGAAVETFTGSTWGALVTAINSGSTHIVAYSNASSAASTTFASAAVVTTGFVGIAASVTAVAAQAVTSSVTCPAFEGPYNEPDDDPTLCAAQMVAFKAACVAGHAGAVVLGPGPVTINSAMSGWITSFLAAANTLGLTLGGFSFHTYNTVDGDMVMCDNIFNQLTPALAAAGWGSVPLWMTEGDGTLVNNFGAMSWRNFTHWMALRTLLFEVHGLPLHRAAHYYMSYFGYNYPAWLKSGAYQQGPVVHPIFSMWRGFSERTCLAGPPTRLAMPGAATYLFFASKYTNPTNVTVALVTAGQASGTMTLTFGSSVASTTYDWAGNTVSTATGSTLVVSVSDLPTYVVVPSATTVTVTDADSGLGALTTNLAATATVHTSSPLPATQINNGVLEDGYYITNGGNGPTQFRDSVPPPAWFVYTWPATQQVSRVILYTAPGWSEQYVPLQWNLYTWSGTAWVLQAAYNNLTATSEPFMTSNATWMTFTEQFWDGQHNFDIVLPTPVSTNGVRLDIIRTSYGSDPDNAAGSPNAGSATSPPFACVREIQVYGPTQPLSAGRFGVFIPSDATAGVITTEETNVGRGFDVILDFYNWNNGTSAIPTVSPATLAAVGTRDYVMTLQPSSGPNGASSANCVQWSGLIAGTYDAQIVAFANWINASVASGAIKGQFYVRFAHEMNGSGFYDWQVGGSCGVTSAANFIAGFNHFASVLKANTSHAQVIWAVNAGPTANIGSFFASGCDVMAFDSYNYGTNGPSSTVTDWLTDTNLYPIPYAAVAACDPSKPIWITETACSEPSVAWTYQGVTYPAEPGFSKATWVTNMLANTAYPRITTVIWFDIAKERNFTITSSPGSTAAFFNAFHS